MTADESLSAAEVAAMLRQLDRRVREVELALARRAQRDPAAPKRSRGRPPGARNLPHVKPGGTLFAETARWRGADGAQRRRRSAAAIEGPAA
jgi:hypothetical protein